MDTFEQVTSDDHKMSLAGGKIQAGGVQGLISRGWVGARLYSEVQCIMGNDHMGTPL